MLKEVLGALANKTVVEFKLSQEKLRNETLKLVNDRTNICLSCDTLDKETMTCLKVKGGCGCNMKLKVYCKTCKCPKGKW